MHLTDTILATSTPPSPPTGGGIRAIIRLSGPDAWPLLQTLTPIPYPQSPGHHGPLALPLLHPTLKIASVLLFKSPRSFTGEDIAELHLPNSPALLRACIDHFLEQSHGNARLAGPGEFSARAFFNHKIDLTEAEGIAATINAATQLELRAAASLREGVLHKEIVDMVARIADALALVEAGIDFSDEEGVSLATIEKMESSLEQLGEYIDQLLSSSLRVDRLNAAPTVVFIGRPNVGKSSLINALTGSDRSIVSDIAGTTRDILSATLHTDHGEVRLIDVPGDETPTTELREKMMDARRRALLEADFVIDVKVQENPLDLESLNWSDVPADHITVWNKADLAPSGDQEEGNWLPGMPKPWGHVSALTGYNIPKLAWVIARQTRRREPVAHQSIVLNQRHRLILQEAKTTIWTCASFARDAETFARHPELLAADLRRALDLLGQITGTISPDDILGRIFSQFCIGK